MSRHPKDLSILSAIFSLVLALGAWSAVEAAGYPFADDFESGLGNWTAEAPWGATTAYYSSPVYSATDSPSTYYGVSVDASLMLASSIDLTTAVRPVLRFYHRHQLEDGYDFGSVEVSTDGGSTWAAPEATYTGATSQWLREQIDLSAYNGYSDVRIRFRLVTDANVSQDGWYVDDVVIAEGPASITLDSPVAITTNSVDLTWDESLEPDFSLYRIYRSDTAGFDWRAATLVAEIDDSTVLAHTDITVTPKTAYYYQIMVLTTADLHALSAEVTATTPAGMDYPFLDNGEGTGTAWSADPTWALTSEDAFSGTHSWSDSPGGDYGDSIPSQSLTLVGPIDLTSASEPVLSFVHHWTFAAGDSGNVEISTDDGSSWTSLAVYTNGTSDGWLRERFDLSAYTSSNEVLVRFRTTTDTSTGADGWYVDDISVAESPTEVDPPILDQVTSHSIRLTWSPSTDLLFSHYAIHRSTSPGVGIKSEFVAEISDQDTTSFTNSGLALDTDYYYRVYAVSPYGTYSPDSTSESTQRTGGNPYPFFDDFEGDLDNWNLTGDWDTTATDYHGGAKSLTDSPSTTYHPSTTWEARTTVDLTTSTWPVLRFWDRFAFADTSDWGYLEVSTDGNNWSRLYTTTSSRAEWNEQAVDLTPWKSSANLRIRFTVTANGTGNDAGWYIDDLSVADHVDPAIAIPFSDDAETGTGNWLPAAWVQSAAAPHDGTSCFRSTPSGVLMASGQHIMELASELDLSQATDPQLVYWLWGTVADDGGFAAQVSTNGGVTWGTLAGGSIGQNKSVPTWTRYQFSLAPYLQAGVRIRFIVTQSRYMSRGTDIYLDDIAIQDMPQPVNLDAPVSHLKSVDLSWSESGLVDFDRYEVYRSTSANVTVAKDLVFSSDDPSDASFTDAGLSIGATYYYRVFVFNSRQVATPSNERSATTVPLTFPLVDPMENLDNWDTDGAWGPDATSFYEGSFSLNDSPDSASTISDTSYILTAIDLTGSVWPVLRFWDRFGMADDWAYLEVSTDGNNWSRLYTATGTRAEWNEQTVDLTPWMTATNLRIRFTVATGGANADEGWYIDDLSVADHVDPAIAIPFSDDAETGTGNWLPAAWVQSAASPHGGTSCFRSTPSGILMASGQHIMELASGLDLSQATDPQLVYWLWGTVADDGGFAAQVSTNGGVTWGTLAGGSIGQNKTVPTWTRYQFSLAPYLQAGVRIRFIVTQSRYMSRGTDIYLDDIAIEDMPQPVNLEAPVPHLKSVDLSWSESGLVDFDRYEVYRSTSANVTVANDLIFSSDNPSDTAFTDLDRSIGATYYYRVFVFNSRQVATPSNERSATTVPLTFPFADPMENLDNWDTDGAWGPDATSPWQGSFSLNDKPGDNSPISSTTFILTAINLTGSAWPVLRFRDRFGMADDWAYLEVSTDGNNWSRLYTATGTRAEWNEQTVDLTPWMTATNLRIRFTVATGGANADEGWYIDDLSVADHVDPAIAIPFSDDAETGTGNWLPAAWVQSAASPHGGTSCFRSTPSGVLMASGQHIMELASGLDLSQATDPQLVYWLRGTVADDGGFAAQVSTNGGVTWGTLAGGSIGQNKTVPTWTRYQFSLAPYLQAGVRIRFIVTQSRYMSRGTDIYLDDIAIEDMPGNVTLSNPDQITISTMRLHWNDLNDPNFAAYAVYRSQTPTVDTSSDLVTTITEQDTTEFVDTGLQARRTYYYRVYFVDTVDAYAPSNSTSATTLGVTIPFNDDFESDTGVWTLTGEWGRVTDAGIENSTSFGDSPGDFIANVDTWAVTGVDLSGTTWPVLTFSDRFDFAGHWGRLEISSNGGANWTILYGATGSQTEWVNRRFDLSPWREQGQVWIRFFVDANSGVPADGWHIDTCSSVRTP